MRDLHLVHLYNLQVNIRWWPIPYEKLQFFFHNLHKTFTPWVTEVLSIFRHMRFKLNRFNCPSAQIHLVHVEYLILQEQVIHRHETLYIQSIREKYMHLMLCNQKLNFNLTNVNLTVNSNLLPVEFTKCIEILYLYSHMRYIWVFNNKTSKYGHNIRKFRSRKILINWCPIRYLIPIKSLK